MAWRFVLVMCQLVFVFALPCLSVQQPESTRLDYSLQKKPQSASGGQSEWKPEGDDLSLSGRYRWPGKRITWSLVKPSQHLPVYVQRSAMRQAFGYWSAAADLVIKEVQPLQQPNIQISFLRLNHTDMDWFDGRGGTLAHAFYPPDGRVHFDDDELWSAQTPGGFDLVAVATHELGHALGLTHSTESDAIMSSYYEFSGKTRYGLHRDDIKRVRELYGANRVGRQVLGDGSRRSLGYPPVELRKPNVCRMKFDDITLFPDGRVYVFRRDWLYRLNYNLGVEDGWPRTLGSVFDYFPESSDAVTYSQESSRLYAFKGKLVWRYFDNKLEVGFPQAIRGEPFRLKAAFSHPNSTIYLLSRRYVYTFDEVTLKATNVGLIRTIFKGAPNNPQAAIAETGQTQLEKGLYILRGNRYVRIDLESPQHDSLDHGSKSARWLGCHDNSRTNNITNLIN